MRILQLPFRFVAVVVFISVVGCTPAASTVCTQTSDCPANQICSENACRAVMKADAGRTTSTGGGGGTTSSGGGGAGGGGGGGTQGAVDSGSVAPVVDAGTPPVVIDAGTPPVVIDAGSPNKADAGTPAVDAGTYPAFRTCTPPGTRTLVNGGVAGPSTAPASCIKPIQASSFDGPQKLSFGTHTVNEVIHFNVPPNTGAISVVEQVVNATSTVGIQGTTVPNAATANLLTTPGGVVLFDDNGTPPADGTTAYVWFQAPSEVTGVMTLPATTAARGLLTSGALPAGQWSLTVNDYAAECAGGSSAICTAGANTTGTYDVTVLLHHGPTPTTGTVDLAFYLVSTTMTASAAMTDANMKRMLDTLSTIYGRAGLCLGTVTFYDVPAWAKTKYATGVNADQTGACDGLNQMFTLSKSGQNTLNFFFVDDIAQSGGGTGTIVGIDGAIPGPSTIGGTVKSGAVVNMTDLSFTTPCTSAIDPANCGPDEVAYITAHEGGHWFGLYHTTESDGASYDPLSDTPTCSCSTTCLSKTAAAKCCDPVTGMYPNNTPCTAAATTVTGANCSSTTKPQCQGADDLMFWIIDTHSVGNFSAEQSAVVRANPVVQ